jgi:IS5 family transposase
MQGQHSSQSSFFGLLYERLVPPDHLLRRIAAAVDLSFVTELVSDCYCPDNGRPSWDPLVLFKVVFLQFLYNLSDRQVEEQVNLHLACKWFVGLQPDETGPDYSALCRFRARLGPEKFQEIFNRIVQQARHAGLVHDRLRILDATHLAAKADLFRLPSPPPETPPAQAPGSPDPDARFGRKSATKSFYGYKEHLATDADSELITAVSVTPGNVADSDEFAGLVDPRAREVTADQGYDTNANHQRLKANGQRSSLILKQNRTNPQVLGQADPESQRQRPRIERKFAEQKQYHGLRQARYWGLAKVTIQVLITCLVVNCKRMARLLEGSSAPPRAALCLAGELRR